jgi:hypothetical protein
MAVTAVAVLPHSCSESPPRCSKRSGSVEHELLLPTVRSQGEDSAYRETPERCHLGRARRVQRVGCVERARMCRPGVDAPHHP